MKLQELSEKKVLLLGFAREGIESLVFLKKRFPDMDIGIADGASLEKLSQTAKDVIEGNNITKLHLGAEYLASLKNYDVVIRTPGINPRTPEIIEARKVGVTFTTATNIFFEEAKGDIIGITGSKGKSTTTTLIYEMLRAGGLEPTLIGNIGLPAISYLEEDNDEKLYVFELSSYQLEELHKGPRILVLVSFFPDHLDYHGSLDAYFDAKTHIVKVMHEGDAIIYNAGFPELAKVVQFSQAEKIPFNDGDMSKIVEDIFFAFYEEVCPTSETTLRGRHNLENILGAMTVAKLYHVDDGDIARALREFRGLPHRLEIVGTYKDITFVNDAISTTPESTIAGMNSFSEPIGSIILGGLDRGYDFAELAKKVLKKGIATVILFPDTGVKIWEAIEKEAKKQGVQLPKKFEATNMKEAVKTAFAATPEATICLLSCASPSYSLFKNYEEKGRLFVEEVKKQSV